ncbi:uncharacterized protein LOC131954286 [Physella acuta]|uniref:uncharacterized protein LOC131954286 n=1 Tax=Physella acuta TaxID=109671 RepID=UPI0027DE2EAC|nr:uncharacterized protein LOC131954286 [Physella acuta]
MASPPRQKITLLLTGKVGYGKSACGNSILGRKAFQADNGSKLCTFMINERSGERDGTLDVRVIDTPGVMELDEKQELINTTIEIPSVMSACPEGIHAICLVLKYDNIFTSEDSQAVSKIKKIFGENFLTNHGVIIMTGGDMLEAKDGREEATFQQWFERQPGELQKLIIECGNRVVLFYNIGTQFVKKRKEAVDQLLNMAMEISKNRLYTQDMFKRSFLVREVEILHLKVPRLRLSMKNSLEEMKSDIFQLIHRDIVTESDLNRLKISNKNILERIIDERKDADIPTQLIDHVEIIHRNLIVFDVKLKVEMQLFQVIKVLDRLLDTPRRRVENTKRSTINVGHSKSASGCDASLKDRSTQSFTDKTMGESATRSSSKV